MFCAPDSPRLFQINQLRKSFWCVRDCYFEPRDSFSKLCKDCVINLGIPLVATDIVWGHRTVLNLQETRSVSCYTCKILLTTADSCQENTCIKCVTHLSRLLSFISESEFQRVVDHQGGAEAIVGFKRILSAGSC